jgi:hypothetical protein
MLKIGPFNPLFLQFSLYYACSNNSIVSSLYLKGVFNMKFIFIRILGASLLVVGSSILQAKLIIQVDQEAFQEIAAGKTVINNGSNRYLTDGEDGFYYMHMSNSGLDLPTSRIRRTLQAMPEEVFLNSIF